MKQLKLFLILVLLQNVNAIAQTPGTLDVSFGTNGIIGTQLPIKNSNGLYISQQARQPDGKYVMYAYSFNYDIITGSFIEKYYLMRYQADGQIDKTYGDNGIVKIDFSVRTIILTADNKLLVCGIQDDEIIIMRYLDNGIPDSTYGYMGKNYSGLYTEFNSATLIANGKVLVSSNHPTDQRIMLIMLDTDGSRDMNFGENGIRYYSYNLNDGYRSVFRIKQYNDGKFLLGGALYSGSNLNTFFIRLNKDFSYDSTFNDDGIQQLPYTGFRLSNFEIMNDGKILAGGFYYFNSYSNIGVVFSRLKGDGSVDSTFGIKGTRTTSFGGGRDLMIKFFLQPDSKIVAIGNSNSRFAIMRLTANGALDPTFNTSGRTVTVFSGCINAEATYVNMEPDGKLLVTGHAIYQDSITKFTMARYHSGYNTSISSVKVSVPISVIPNPLTNDCRVVYTVKNAQPVHLTLYNSFGQLVYEQILESQTTGKHELLLSLSELPSGIYFLNIKSGEASGVVKLVKAE